MPISKLKQHLESYLAMLLQEGLIILPFEKQSSEWLAIERARLMKLGFPPAYADAEIAAVSAINGLVLITRNTNDFKRFSDLQLENWFEE